MGNKSNEIVQYDVVITTSVTGDATIIDGVIGAVLDVYEGPPKGYLVEFVCSDGKVIATKMYNESEIKLV